MAGNAHSTTPMPVCRVWPMPDTPSIDRAACNSRAALRQCGATPYASSFFMMANRRVSLKPSRPYTPCSARAPVHSTHAQW